MTKYIKVTEFTARSSGDMECFCFDKRTLKQQREFEVRLMEEIRKPDPYQITDICSSVEYLYPGTSIFDEQDEARVYPSDLLPEECEITSIEKDWERPMGKWKITVEFEPNEND
jgi:hypothetical protein